MKTPDKTRSSTSRTMAGVILLATLSALCGGAIADRLATRTAAGKFHYTGLTTRNRSVVVQAEQILVPFQPEGLVAAALDRLIGEGASVLESSYEDALRSCHGTGAGKDEGTLFVLERLDESPLPVAWKKPRVKAAGHVSDSSQVRALVERLLKAYGSP